MEQLKHSELLRLSEGLAPRLAGVGLLPVRMTEFKGPFFLLYPNPILQVARVNCRIQAMSLIGLVFRREFEIDPLKRRKQRGPDCPAV
jgi:hypothetical protein